MYIVIDAPLAGPARYSQIPYRVRKGPSGHRPCSVSSPLAPPPIPVIIVNKHVWNGGESSQV